MHMSSTQQCIDGEKEQTPIEGLLKPISPPKATRRYAPCTQETGEPALLDRPRLETSEPSAATEKECIQARPLGMNCSQEAMWPKRCCLIFARGDRGRRNLSARSRNLTIFYQELLKENSNPRLKGNRKGIIVKGKEFYIPILNTFPTR